MKAIVCSLIFCLITLVLWVLSRFAKFKKYNLSKWAIGTLFISIFCTKLAITIYEGNLEPQSNPVLEAAAGMNLFEKLADCVLHSLQTFSLDESYTEYVTAFKDLIQPVLGGKAAAAGGVYLYVLSALAPISVAAAVLSFFNEFITGVKIRFTFKKLFIFSELNERSIVLAESISKKKNRLRNRIVFTDVYRVEEEGPTELIERAKSINAWLTRKDILSNNFYRKVIPCRRSFFVLGSNESENIRHSIELIRKNRKYGERVEIYVFSEREECQALIENEDTGKMAVKNIDTHKIMIWNNINEHGYEYLFNGYKHNGPEREISIAVIGLGRYGTEMLQTLTWYCQIPGIKTSITGYDKRPDVEDRLRMKSPWIFTDSPDINSNEGINYSITIRESVDVNTRSFLEELKRQCPQYIFISLGDDAANISAAMNVRAFLYFEKPNPVIDTVVFDEKECELLKKLKKPKKNGKTGEIKPETAYNIQCFGSINEVYSIDNVNKWLGEDINKWKYSYFRNSSIASKIHHNLREKINLPADGSALDTRTEHYRWNAYMRSIGYTYGVRNDLAGTHDCLKPYEELTKSQIKKDVYKNTVRGS